MINSHLVFHSKTKRFSFVLNHVLVLYVGGSMVAIGSLAAAGARRISPFVPPVVLCPCCTFFNFEIPSIDSLLFGLLSIMWHAVVELCTFFPLLRECSMHFFTVIIAPFQN